jgi:hypothetical protein
MKESTYHPQDFLNAEEICNYLLQNRAIQFQATGAEMDRESAVRHFKEREALIVVKKMLLDEGERALRGASPPSFP